MKCRKFSVSAIKQQNILPRIYVRNELHDELRLIPDANKRMRAVFMMIDKSSMNC